MRLYTNLEAALDSKEGSEVIYPVTGVVAVMSLDEGDMFIDCVISDIKARETVTAAALPKIRWGLYEDIAEQFDIVKPVPFWNDEDYKAVIDDYVAAVMDKLADYVAEVNA